MKKTIGGDRLGSGKKMETELKNYGRSTHNLNKAIITSAAPGVLIPFYRNIVINGDTFDIDLSAAARTLPTKAPLFGSFKLQMDMFSVPIRLYQGILHNNPINIGMQMDKVYLPKIELKDTCSLATNNTGNDFDHQQTASNCLLRYLGIAGIGHGVPQSGLYIEAERKFTALGILAYYDIFKNYYANKQEENAYVITPKNNGESVLTWKSAGCDVAGNWMGAGGGTIYITDSSISLSPSVISTDGTEVTTGWYLTQYFVYLSIKEGNIMNEIANDNLKLYVNERSSDDSVNTLIREGIITDINTDQYVSFYLMGKTPQNRLENECWFLLDINTLGNYLETLGNYPIEFAFTNRVKKTNAITLTPFPLENIDKMRTELLSSNELGDEYVITASNSYLPYSTLVKKYENFSPNIFSQNGLVVKTYQSDIFNNWINTDWIDGENGISAVTAIDVSGGLLYADALNLQKKAYEMLNRIAISGGTYDDWQEAVWGQEAIRKAETPIYIGGMSAEIVFSEVVSTSETETDGDIQKLGTLAGKGELHGHHGGKITVKINEPSILIGIMSITPRICYTQGNNWINNIDTLNDLHKPALDGIGFQELITDQMAWWDTKAKYTPEGTEITTKSAGKQPAWINYMTDYDEAFGEFADEEKAAYMILSRHYEPEQNNDETWKIKDLTTYIDPTKYNYPFAYDKLDAQNFWIQAGAKITARRKMSAKIIPNL